MASRRLSTPSNFPSHYRLRRPPVRGFFVGERLQERAQLVPAEPAQRDVMIAPALLRRAKLKQSLARAGARLSLVTPDGERDAQRDLVLALARNFVRSLVPRPRRVE